MQNPLSDDYEKEVIDEPPPVLGTWQRVYVFVICWLVIVVAAFYLFTRAFAS